MNSQQFQEWLENPATEIFLKYLKDSAKDEAQLVSDTILNGSVFDVNEQIKISTVCITLNEISEITFEEIDDFYQERKL